MTIIAIIKPNLYTTAKWYSGYNNDSLRVYSIKNMLNEHAQWSGQSIKITKPGLPIKPFTKKPLPLLSQARERFPGGGSAWTAQEAKQESKSFLFTLIQWGKLSSTCLIWLNGGIYSQQYIKK